MKEPTIKPQLKLLVTNYLGKCCGNAVQSAIEAGYKPTYAKAQSYKLFARDDVKEYMAYLRSKEGFTERKILEIADIQEYWSTVIKDEEIDTKNRLRASELLAKSKGMFNNDW